MTRRVLLIEDTEDNRQIIRDLLETVGIELVEAVDGAAGVEAAKREKPDLILMDMQMPVMDGYQATRAIKADPDLAHIPVIAVTAFASLNRQPVDLGLAQIVLKDLQAQIDAGFSHDLPVPFYRVKHGKRVREFL